MNILIDAGNTCLKWQIKEEEMTQWIDYEDQLPEVCLQRLLTDKNVKHLIIVHVLGDQFTAFINQLGDLLSINLVIINTQIHHHGIQLGYTDQSAFGADRLVAMIGARYLFNLNPSSLNNKALMVVDCGTAVTIDLLLMPDCHQGGVILPGFTLWQNSLINNARQIQPYMLKKATQKVLANNTQEAVIQGAKVGLPAAINGIIEQMLLAVNIKEDLLTLMLTGGDSVWIEKKLTYAKQWEPNLIFIGLRVIADG